MNLNKTKLKEIVEPERARQGITQDEMSYKLKISCTTYRKWVYRYQSERGGKPTFQDLQDIIKILGLENFQSEIMKDLEIS